MAANTEKLHLKGYSTNTKPNLGLKYDGSDYLELDTNIVYIYCGVTGVWEANIKSDTIVSAVGIKEIKKTSSSGVIDTYTIFYTNGATTTYEVTNGASKPDQVVFKTHYEFPNVGDMNTLYIATDENKIYRWTENNAYVSLTDAASVPSEIDGGDANTVWTNI